MWTGSPIATSIGAPVQAEVDPPATAPAALVRFINVRGEYEIDPATRRFRKSTKLEQLVWLALSTRKRTSTAKPDLGVERVTIIDSDFQRRMELRIGEALRHVVAAGLGRLESVRVVLDESVPGRVYAYINWTKPNSAKPETIGPVPVSL